ncbi:MAG: GIY-YIG nuclease family protein [Rhodospirillaceae bacterium]|nr:GIY-YIG nuclease family protein [Rhodospirillaceae bacterium]
MSLPRAAVTSGNQPGPIAPAIEASALMDIALNWQGPVAAGCIPVAVGDDLDALSRAGIYLRVKSYQGGRLVAYGGQTVNLFKRFDEHLRGTLGLDYVLRDSAGDVAVERGVGARMAAYNDLPRVAALALDEAVRTRFLYAPCGESFDPELLNLAETLLVERLRERLGAAAGIERSSSLRAVENLNRPPRPDETPGCLMHNELEDLDDENQILMGQLLGAEPMIASEAAMGWGDYG